MIATFQQDRTMATQIPEVKYALTDDRTKVALSINGSEATFTTKEFEGFLGWLGTIRTQMAPPVPTEVAEGMQVSQLTHVFLGHRKGMPPVPAESGMVVAVRSELFGWFEFAADPEFCRGMIAWMNSTGAPQQVEPTPPPQ
jgi:hypothetical protein